MEFTKARSRNAKFSLNSSRREEPIIKRQLKAALEKSGYIVYHRNHLPVGMNWFLDLRRLAPALKVRTVFDVGANVGHCTREFSAEFPGADVLAFEPEQENFDILESAVKSLPKAQSFHLALGSEAGTCELHLQADSQWHSLVPEKNRPHSSSPPSQKISVETLDKFCREHEIETIDVLKTDTEGFDLEVLKGAQQMLEAGRISFILTEVGFSLKDKAHTFFPDLLAHLTPLEYEFYDFYDRPAMRNEGAPRVGYCNALFVNAKI